MEELILNALLELSENKQIGDITIRDIANKGGFSVGTIYNHFSNKNDIVNALYLKLKDEVTEVMVTAKEQGMTVMFESYIDFGFKNKIKYNYIFSDEVRKVITNETQDKVDDYWLKDIRSKFPKGEEQVCSMIMFGTLDTYIKSYPNRDYQIENQIISKFKQLIDLG